MYNYDPKMLVNNGKSYRCLMNLDFLTVFFCAVFLFFYIGCKPSDVAHDARFRSGEKLPVFTYEIGERMSCSDFRDGLCAVGWESGLVSLYRNQDGQLLWEKKVHANRVCSVFISTQTCAVASMSIDNTCLLSSVKDGGFVAVLIAGPPESDNVWEKMSYRHGGLIAGQCSEALFAVARGFSEWSRIDLVSANGSIQKVSNPGLVFASGIKFIAFSRDGSLLITQTWNGDVLAWDWKHERIVWSNRAIVKKDEFNQPEKVMNKQGRPISFCDHSDVVAIGEGRRIVLYNGHTGTAIDSHVISEKSAEEVGFNSCLAFSEDGKRLAASTLEGNVYVWMVTGWKKLAKFEILRNSRANGECGALWFSNCGEMLSILNAAHTKIDGFFIGGANKGGGG